MDEWQERRWMWCDISNKRSQQDKKFITEELSKIYNLEDSDYKDLIMQLFELCKHLCCGIEIKLSIEFEKGVEKKMSEGTRVIEIKTHPYKTIADLKQIDREWKKLKKIEYNRTYYLKQMEKENE